MATIPALVAKRAESTVVVTVDEAGAPKNCGCRGADANEVREAPPPAFTCQEWGGGALTEGIVKQASSSYLRQRFRASKGLLRGSRRCPARVHAYGTPGSIGKGLVLSMGLCYIFGCRLLDLSTHLRVEKRAKPTENGLVGANAWRSCKEFFDTA